MDADQLAALENLCLYITPSRPGQAMDMLELVDAICQQDDSLISRVARHWGIPA